jgi:DNA-binding NarL/FixJ family response regulator
MLGRVKLMKQETGVHVVQALRQVLRGETFLSDRLRSGSRGRKSGSRAARPRSPR